MKRAALVALLLSVRCAVAQEPARLTGRVVDGATGSGISGAEISTADGRRTLSDSSGRWWLAADAGTLRVRRLGYGPRSVEAAPGTPAIVRLDLLPLPLDAMIVTAARREQRLADAVPETRLLTRADVDASGGGDVAAVLTQATGVQAEGGVPAGAGVLLQGLGSQRVLILLDGQPLTGRINGTFDLSRLPSSLIERVEIVRGSQSTLYGSDAMGGVVNVITRSPASRAAASITAIGGTQGRREGTFNASVTRGALGALVDAGFRGEALAPGIDVDDGTQARRWNVAPRLRWHGGTLDLDASALVIGERQRYRTGQLYHFGDNTQVATRLAATRRSGPRALAAILSWSRFDHLSRAATSPQPVSDSGQRDVQDLVQAELTWSGPLPAGLLDAGVLLRHDAIRADRVRDTARSINGVEAYAQGTWGVGPVELSPGLRVTHNEQWGGAMTPRVAALVRPVPAVAIRASVGAGYRAPDFKELYIDFANAAAGYAVQGNPGLRPERSINANLGIEVAGSRAYGLASMFTNRLQDFIDFGPPDAGGTYTYENVGRAVTRGIDAEAGWTPRGARLTAGYSWLDAFDASTGQPLLGRSRHAARFTAGTTILRTALTASVGVTGRAPVRRDDATGAITEWRGTLTRVDLRARFMVASSWELFAGVDNALDDVATGTWPGFAGRRVHAGARLELGR